MEALSSVLGSLVPILKGLTRFEANFSTEAKALLGKCLAQSDETAARMAAWPQGNDVASWLRQGAQVEGIKRAANSLLTSLSSMLAGSVPLPRSSKEGLSELKIKLAGFKWTSLAEQGQLASRMQQLYTEAVSNQAEIDNIEIKVDEVMVNVLLHLHPAAKLEEGPLQAEVQALNEALAIPETSAECHHAMLSLALNSLQRLHATQLQQEGDGEEEEEEGSSAPGDEEDDEDDPFYMPLPSAALKMADAKKFAMLAQPISPEKEDRPMLELADDPNTPQQRGSNGQNPFAMTTPGLTAADYEPVPPWDASQQETSYPSGPSLSKHASGMDAEAVIVEEAKAIQPAQGHEELNGQVLDRSNSDQSQEQPEKEVVPQHPESALQGAGEEEQAGAEKGDSDRQESNADDMEPARGESTEDAKEGGEEGIPEAKDTAGHAEGEGQETKVLEAESDASMETEVRVLTPQGSSAAVTDEQQSKEVMEAKTEPTGAEANVVPEGAPVEAKARPQQIDVPSTTEGQKGSPDAAAAVTGTPGTEGVESPLEEKQQQFVQFLQGDNPGACMFHAQMRLSLEGCRKLANFLASSPRVRALSLSHNHLGDDGMEIICKGLSINRSVTAIDLPNNNITDIGVTLLAGAIANNPSLTQLQLSYNRIGDTGAQALAEFLKGNASVKKIGLSNNNIGRVGCQALAAALSSNQSLKQLQILPGNPVEEKDAKALAKALKRKEKFSIRSLLGM